MLPLLPLSVLLVWRSDHRCPYLCAAFFILSAMLAATPSVGIDSSFGCQVSYSELLSLMALSGEVYLPCTTLGGGERAMLEARAVGTRVTVLCVDTCMLFVSCFGVLTDSNFCPVSFLVFL